MRLYPELCMILTQDWTTKCQTQKTRKRRLLLRIDTDSSESECESEPTPRHQPGRGCQTKRGPMNVRSNRGAHRGRGNVRGRGNGHGRGNGRGRARNVQPHEYQWEEVDFFDDFSIDWLGYPRQTGVLIDTSDYSPVDYFKCFFPDEVFDILTPHTNLYASQFLEGRDLATHSRFRKWRDTTSKEMEACVALLIAMGLNCKPEIPDYWRDSLANGD